MEIQSKLLAMAMKKLLSVTDRFAPDLLFC
jgi:hypothetical protein